MSGVFIIILMIAILSFVVAKIFYPNWIKKKGAYIENPSKRDKPILMSDRYGETTIEGGERFSGGDCRLNLRGKGGEVYAPVFNDGELEFANMFQAMVGQSPPLVLHREISKRLLKDRDKRYDDMERRADELEKDKDANERTIRVMTRDKYEAPEKILDEVNRVLTKTRQPREEDKT